MDYSIGSLADMISGTTTPNKLAVLKQKVSPKKQTPRQEITIRSDKKPKKSPFKKEKTPKNTPLKIKSQFSPRIGVSPSLITPSQGKSQRADTPNVKPLTIKTTKRKKSHKTKFSTSPFIVEDIEMANDTSLQSDKHAEDSDESGDIAPNFFDTKSSDNESDSEGEASPKKSAKKTLNVNASNAQKRIDFKNKTDKIEKKSKIERPEDPEANERTVFVGNLPNTIKKNQIKTLFKEYGAVESVRLRCAAVSDVRVPKKVAVIKRDFHADRSNIHSYVRFKDVEGAIKAVAANGTVFLDHHIRVDLVSKEQVWDESRAIFVGNIPYSAEEDDLWKAFAECGDIDSVRIVRDRKTGVGKGFGYVNFTSNDSVELALKCTDATIEGRQLRVTRAVNSKKKSEKAKKGHSNKRDEHGNKKRKRMRSQGAKKRIRCEDGGVSTEQHKTETEKILKIDDTKSTPAPSKAAEGFEGATSDKKKKKKKNKGELEKKKMVKRLAPRPKGVPKNQER